MSQVTRVACVEVEVQSLENSQYLYIYTTIHILCFLITIVLVLTPLLYVFLFILSTGQVTTRPRCHCRICRCLRPYSSQHGHHRSCTALNDFVEDRVRQIVADHLGVDKEEVTNSSNFIRDLAADSLDIVELDKDLEDRFGITIPDDYADKIKTVQDAIDYVNKHKS